MPRRSASKNKIVNRPICKNAGAGGFSGSKVMRLCHNRARIGLAQGQRMCTSTHKTVGKAGTPVPCSK
tara:strand:+ start:79 stop:282 length:204 start_codon:yes stop_codon:yes gene_type:complete